MSTTEHVGAARRYLGDAAPDDVVAAKARTYAWRPFAKHTDEERAAHVADEAVVQAYVESRPAFDIAPDPMGDE